MNAEPIRTIAEAKAIVIEELTRARAVGGSIAVAQLAIYNRLRDAGQIDVAELLMIHERMSMANDPSSKPSVTIHVKDSTVGNIVFDSVVTSINASVTALAQKDASGAEFANALKELTDAVTSTSELRSDQKKGVLDALELVGKQAEESPNNRKMTILGPVLDSIPKLLSSAASLVSLWHNLGPQILAFFGLS